MARIRTIKPEFPHSESLGRVSRDARLTFILLWTLADDSGRLRGSSRMLASLLFPYDDDAGKKIDGWLDALEQEGCIRRYSVDGQAYVDIPKWLEHQKIDRPSQSKIPPFIESSSNPRESSRILVVGVDQGVDQGVEHSLSGKPDDARMLIDFLNAKAGARYSYCDANLKIIKARLKEHSIQDLKTMIVKKCREWKGTDYEKYLRPETLFRPTKCDSYVGQCVEVTE